MPTQKKNADTFIVLYLYLKILLFHSHHFNKKKYVYFCTTRIYKYHYTIIKCV